MEIIKPKLKSPLMNANIVVMIPARNEEDALPKTLEALEKQSHAVYGVVVVDDGSSDRTAEIAREYDCIVLDREDRGYNAVAEMSLVNTFNDGFNVITQELNEYDYVCVLGADTVLPKNYLSSIICRMKKNDIHLASGVIEGEEKVNNVRGSGRVISRELFMQLGGRYPRNELWESYILYFAPAYGYQHKVFRDLVMKTQRITYANYNWNKMYYRGLSSGALGYHPVYHIVRSVRLGIKTKRLRSIYHYWRGVRSADRIDDAKILEYVRNYQKERIRQFMIGIPSLLLFSVFVVVSSPVILLSKFYHKVRGTKSTPLLL